MATTRVPDSLRRVAHRASRTPGRLTHGARMVPSFLIVGAQRSGTTSMYRTLARHPAVLEPLWRKGVHYFDTDYGHDFAWYRGHFPLRRTGERVRRRLDVAAITGESSPYYMFHPRAAERIAADLPHVRLIVLLRDPVERAYSAHTHERARGFETEPFEAALALEQERLRDEEAKIRADPTYYSHSHQHHAYLARGRYIDQLERLERLVGRARMHVVDSHDFFTDPEPVYEGVLRFLGLPLVGWPPFDRHNARPRSPMPEQLRARLREHFRVYDERLACWLGTVPSWRR